MSRDPSPAQTSTLFRNGLLFDGTGAAGEVQDLLIRDGRVARIGKDLPSEDVDQVVDCAGIWAVSYTHLTLPTIYSV